MIDVVVLLSGFVVAELLRSGLSPKGTEAVRIDVPDVINDPDVINVPSPAIGGVFAFKGEVGLLSGHSDVEEDAMESGLPEVNDAAELLVTSVRVSAGGSIVADAPGVSVEVSLWSIWASVGGASAACVCAGAEPMSLLLAVVVVVGWVGVVTPSGCSASTSVVGA